MRPDATEIRVLGSLLEKQRTTPDAYPLTLNALRLACNQSTNRDPVLELGEDEIRAALARLAQRRWTRAASGAGSRAPKYRQLFDEALGLAADETALLAVLMLRGPQTPGELKGRVERLHHFSGPEEVAEALERLAGRGLAEALPRRRGEKQARWRHSLGGDSASGGEASPLGLGEVGEPLESGSISARLDRLEAEAERLRGELATLRRDLEA